MYRNMEYEMYMEYVEYGMCMEYAILKSLFCSLFLQERHEVLISLVLIIMRSNAGRGYYKLVEVYSVS